MLVSNRSLHIHITRVRDQPGWARVELRKRYWSRSLMQTLSVLVGETWVYTEGMSERDTYEACLRDLLRLLADDIA